MRPSARWRRSGGATGGSGGDPSAPNADRCHRCHPHAHPDARADPPPTPTPTPTPAPTATPTPEPTATHGRHRRPHLRPRRKVNRQSQGQTSVYPTVVNADQVRAQGTTGRGVTVAILDSGVAPDPDLGDRILASVNFADQRVTRDPGGHGTHVAGIVAGNGARSDGEFVGIAPEANIIDVRVLDSSGAGRISSVVRGIEWVVAHRRRLQHPRHESLPWRAGHAVVPHRPSVGGRGDRLAAWHRGRRRFGKQRTAARHRRFARHRSVRDHRWRDRRSWNSHQRRRCARLLLGVGHR